MKIRDVEMAKAIIAHEAVNCFCGQEQSAAEQPHELVSCTGGTFWGKPGERWPSSAAGEPLIPWLQIVCTEMDRLYGAFYRRKAVCFYIADRVGSDVISANDNGDFVVREYALEEKLVPLDYQVSRKVYPFHQVIWQPAKDYPSLSKYYGLFDKSTYDELCQIKDFEYENRPGIKIGGWPTPIQTDQKYPGTCDLQIDMTETFGYGDSGIGYLSKRGGMWHVGFECC